MSAAKVEFPAKLQPLFTPARYKVLHGGRGGAKSWGVARALVILGAQKPMRVLCAREIQKSMKDSVHKLLADQIEALGLSGYYEVLEKGIRGKPGTSADGTEFMFEGLRHNIDNIKSKEAIDVAWVEEAATVSKTSWEKLIPTIRKDGSEIWVTFNPELAEDETYKRFVANPPTDAIVIPMSWRDNPWFPDVLKREAADLEARDPAAYAHVYGGACKKAVEGAVYAREIEAAETDSPTRITRVPYDLGKPVSTFWDLGRADMTSIWFGQVVGFEFRLIDFYQSRGHALPHYLKVLADKPYVYSDHWLPHDANHELLGSERTILQQMQDAGRPAQITPMLGVAEGINAARTIFNRCWFDGEKCADGISALRRYRYDIDATTGRWSQNPVHDDASHAADAFRYLAVALQPSVKRAGALKRNIRGLV